MNTELSISQNAGKLAEALSRESGVTWKCTDCKTDSSGKTTADIMIEDGKGANMLSNPKLNDLAEAIPSTVATVSLIYLPDNSGISRAVGLSVESHLLNDESPIGRLMIVMRPFMKELAPKENVAAETHTERSLEPTPPARREFGAGL